MLSEKVVGMAGNGWTASIGIDGQHRPDYAVARRTVQLQIAQAGAQVYISDWTADLN